MDAPPSRAGKIAPRKASSCSNRARRTSRPDFMNRPSVDPAFTFGISFAISLALWLPTFRDTLTGRSRSPTPRSATSSRSRSRGPRSRRCRRSSRCSPSGFAWPGLATARPSGARDISPARRRADDDAPRSRARSPRATPPEGQAAGACFTRLAGSLLPAPDQAVTLGRSEAAPHAVAGAGLECVLETLLAHRADRADRLGLGRRAPPT